MSTQDFLAQNDSNFTQIRYYTALDPYFYAVDNRPLQDIETNLKDIRNGGGDAARRAAILGALGVGSISAHILVPDNYSRGMTGLRVNQIDSTTVRIGPGAVFDTRSISESILDNVVKIALSTKSTDFTVAPPLLVGTSIIYTIEGEFVELTQANMISSNLPYVDKDNKYLPSTLMNGELKLSINSGTPGNTGTEIAPATTFGKFPIYNINISQGSTTYTVSLHPNAPYTKGLKKSVRPVPLAVNGATLNIANDIQAFSFAEGVVNGVILPITLDENLNPYAPIKLKFTISPSAANGNASFRVRYKGFSTGELTATPTINSPIDNLPVGSVANAIKTDITVNAVIPNTEISGFVNGIWSINKEYLNIVFERVGDDSGDTNTGSVNLIGITLFQ